MIHHALSALVFVFCLATRTLGAVGACGLVYEIPVIFLNARDILVDVRPRHHAVCMLCRTCTSHTSETSSMLGV